MSNPNNIQIIPAKGRPFLQWVGKQPLKHITAYPAQQVEVYTAGAPAAGSQADLWQDWPAGYPRGGLLFHGDNKDVLAHLLANGFRGKVKLIYIDPPFDSGADYVRKVELRKIKNSRTLDSVGYSIGEQIQYSDIWSNDTYLQFMFERLILLKELLSEDGSFWLHCDYHRSHYLKCVCDEVFSDKNFVDEIIWKRAAPRGNVKRGLSVAHDTIFVYGKGSIPKWHPPSLEYSEAYKARFNLIDDDGRHYALDNMISPNPDRPNLDYEWKGVRRVWRVSKDKMQELEELGRLGYTAQGVARYKRYLDELEGQPLTTLWDDIFPVNSQADERENYRTQKPEALIERMLVTATDPGDIVLDCFIGSGTTAAAAQKLGRHWIAADINKGAVQTTTKRLQTIIQEQAALRSRQQLELPNIEHEGDHPAPAQLSFAVYRVNDYDLQIQHNEALSLACEHLGVTRTKTDRFFDGTLGKRLVKIIPFNHPLTPLDLEEIRREMQSRPEEGRDMVVVSLGKELAADAWLEDWNRLRARGDAPNKIEAIELRTDPRVGGFFTHEPAQAEVAFRRESAGEVCVEITNFISPTILERLRRQSGVLSPQITDWRSMVDSVMIDPAYDGEVFNIALTDVPEKKDDLVAGVYRLSAPEGETAVAVKITDMLGEEVLVVARV